jgi:hypothetical protein
MAEKLPTPHERALRRAKYLTGLMWHLGAFVIINVFFWILDAMGAGGINWAFWITGTWGFGLAFHTLAYFVDGRDLQGRKAAQYEAEDRARTASSH